MAILGGGPSMEGLDIQQLTGTPARIIAINDAFRLVPWADLLYFCDRKWWDGPFGRVAQVQAGFYGRVVTLDNDIPAVLKLRNTGETGWDDAPDALRTGRNSGYQAMQIAAKLGAKRIVLFGYDFRVVNGRTHEGERPERQQPADFARALAVDMLPCFEGSREPLAGVEVVNASPGSWLRVWPVVDHSEGLRLLG